MVRATSIVEVAVPTSARNHLALAWCGPVGIITVLVGWAVCAGFLPPPSPDLSVDAVAQIWQAHTNLKRLGMIMCVWGGTLYVPFTIAVTILMRRMERGEHILSTVQAALGTLASVFFTVNFIFFEVASFRPDRPAEVTQQIHDLGFIMTFAPAAPFFFQYLVVAVAILQDESHVPLVPRWLAYANLWIAVGVVPGCLLPFFKTGPLAWNGVFTFWIPVGVFVAWYFLMFWAVRRAITASTSGATDVMADA
jgi:hypothetical protein